MTGRDDPQVTPDPGTGLGPQWRAYRAADTTVRDALAHIGQLYQPRPDHGPTRSGARQENALFHQVDRHQIDRHRHEVLLPALLDHHAAADAVVADLAAQAHRASHAGPALLDALDALAAVMADSWTAAEVGGAMSCREVDTLARVLDLAGHTPAAVQLLCGHTEHEDGDDHDAMAPGRAGEPVTAARDAAARLYLARLQRATPPPG